MSDSAASGFGKFVPGFDFLQSLVKGSASVPGVSSWVAPTLDPKELDKRIDELKAVQFWLDQNANALKATIQALELQKMTLATLKGMNVDMSSMANAFKFPAASPAAPEPAPAPATVRAKVPEPEPEPEPEEVEPVQPKAAAPVVDPMQLWGALTQQFQQIAAGAMKEATKQSTFAPAAAPAPKKTALKPAAKKKAAPRKR